MIGDTIKADVLLSVGNRRVLIAAQSGQVAAPTKDGPIAADYFPGDAILADERGEVIVGPIGPDVARYIAVQALAGNARVLTDPKTVLALALALAAFIPGMPTDPVPNAQRAHP